ncbi:MAG: tRNA (guanosine(46)-N7)-methyltransferase TrmB [Planctomycetales bacterium]|nr:tRNA (guanosine(46)-N7)-methyltransferase TrmB [Planctomycetales bacterium]
MGRRALRKIDKSVDLSNHLKVIDQLVPWDPERIFGRSAPLEVEVGSGKGLFLQTASSECPQHNFLGIEIAKKYAEFAAFGLANQNATNAVMMSGDAQPLFYEHFPDHSIHAVHVYFPDPWWKKRHRKRRIMNKTFLTHVIRVLVPGGKLHFWTDVHEYFESALDLIREELPELKGPLAVDEKPSEHDFDYRTHFERRMRMHDKPVYRSQFTT